MVFIWLKVYKISNMTDFSYYTYLEGSIIWKDNKQFIIVNIFFI